MDKSIKVCLTDLLFKYIKTEIQLAIIKFRDWRATFESENSTVNASDIPRQFIDLIALLAHERSVNYTIAV